jgi:hypothetical protein
MFGLKIYHLALLVVIAIASCTAIGFLTYTTVLLITQ